MPWPKGVSGNPAGRRPQGRASEALAVLTRVMRSAKRPIEQIRAANAVLRWHGKAMEQVVRQIRADLKKGIATLSPEEFAALKARLAAVEAAAIEEAVALHGIEETAATATVAAGNVVPLRQARDDGAP